MLAFLILAVLTGGLIAVFMNRSGTGAGRQHLQDAVAEARRGQDRTWDRPGSSGPALTPVAPVGARRQVFVGDQEYVAAPHPGDATPYYYPGGMVGGRPAPAGWYSTPWWKTALVAGAAGVGGALLMDSLLEGFHHHGGPFDGFGPDGLF